MLFPNSVRVAPGVRSALAVACGVVLSGAGVAQAQDEVAPVVVTASRMPQLLQTAPIGATVITAEQIARSGVADANEAVRKLGGVAATSDLNGGREDTLDLRGFGATAIQNLVVLVDGIRLSENENVAARLTSIPLAQIDHIEVVRGGASVMWGEGASAGVINVILKHASGPRTQATLSAAVESFGGQDVLASGEWGQANLAVTASFKRVRSEGYRDNSAYKQDVSSLSGQWHDADSSVGLRVTHEGVASRLPGALPYATFVVNPRASDTPDDDAHAQVTRYTGQASHRVGAVNLQLDAGYRERTANYQYVSLGSDRADTHSTQTQWTPRMAYDAGLWGADVKALLGLDWQHWSFDKTGVDGLETGSQSNEAVFVHLDASLPTRTRINLGWRQERVSKAGDYPGNSAWGSLPAHYLRHDKLHAGELGVSQTLIAGWDVYGRASSSYRLANVDDNRLTPSQGPLLPQQNTDRELGVKWTHGSDGGTLRLFRQRTVNEIGFDPIAHVNANLDPTRRSGTELEAHWRPVPSLTLSGTWQQITARFRGGANAGRDITQVAPHTATLRASYRINEQHTVELGAQHMAAMRYAGDEANQCTIRMPSSTLLDARYAWTDRVWTVAVGGSNLADKRGFNYGYSYNCGAPSVYPYAGRSLKLTVSRQF